VKLLLDTQVFVWWAENPAKLSSQALQLCQEPDNPLILSVVSIWEIQIKHQLGRARFIVQTPLRELIERQQQENDVILLRVELAHVLELEELPTYPEHKDPFDRLLIAQAKVEGATLLSVDNKMHTYTYPVSLLR